MMQVNDSPSTIWVDIRIANEFEETLIMLLENHCHRALVASGLLMFGIALSPSTTALAFDDENPTYTTVEEAAVDPDFAFQGEYNDADADDDAGGQVIALGDGLFRCIIYRGGLPGDGGDFENKLSSEGNREEIQAVLNLHELKRVERTSETLGMEPPEGAVVLIDGTEETLAAHWRDGARLNDDGLLMQGATTTDLMGDFTLHLEFLLPYMPKARGQGRANSGMYLQGRYEVQILDSFGLEGLDNECGGIYSISRPDLNMCLPPLVWQTYDVEFTAARFNDAGNKTANAHAVIRLNGVVIHDRELDHGTPGGPLNSESSEPGPLYLQDHGNPVRFRNIWFVAE